MGIINKLKQMRQESKEKAEYKKSPLGMAENLKKLRKERIKLEGRAGLIKAQAKERSRISKARQISGGQKVSGMGHAVKWLQDNQGALGPARFNKQQPKKQKKAQPKYHISGGKAYPIAQPQAAKKKKKAPKKRTMHKSDNILFDW